MTWIACCNPDCRCWDAGQFSQLDDVLQWFVTQWLGGGDSG